MHYHHLIGKEYMITIKNILCLFILISTSPLRSSQPAANSKDLSSISSDDARLTPYVPLLAIKDAREHFEDRRKQLLDGLKGNSDDVKAHRLCCDYIAKITDPSERDRLTHEYSKLNRTRDNLTYFQRNFYIGQALLLRAEKEELVKASKQREKELLMQLAQKQEQINILRHRNSSKELQSITDSLDMAKFTQLAQTKK